MLRRIHSRINVRLLNHRDKPLGLCADGLGTLDVNSVGTLYELC